MIRWWPTRCESTGLNLIEVSEVAEKQGKAPVEQDAPVEPTRSRRGRRKLEDVEAGAARAAAETRAKADAAKTSARTKTALLTEQEKQQQILDRKKAADLKKRQERNAQRWATFKFRAAAAGRSLMVVGPIAAPMSIAWTGQIGFAQKVLDWAFAGGVAYAAAYELTIIFCAWMYHEARKDGDSGTYYRALTWFFAVANGVQQWWHWSVDWSATPRSVAYSTMTMIGILVWEAYNKLVIRRKLRADGLLTNPRPRIGLVRWLRYFPISWTAWSGAVLHGFDNFNDMWTWAEIERESKRSKRDKIKTQRARIKELERTLADLQKATKGSVIKGEVERIVTPDPEPTPAPQQQIDPGPVPELEPAPEVNPGSPDAEFEPTAAEVEAIKEMVEAEIALNRQNVMEYIRDEDNRHRLGQPEGIATKRAALVAKWGRDNQGNIKAVS